MEARALRSRLEHARLRNALWVRLLDQCRLLFSSEGRARIWTILRHGAELHQTAPYTWLNRYPELFDGAAKLAPDARRILSFGCSTGEELISLRHRFPDTQIVGAEINARSRRAAKRQLAADPNVTVVAPQGIIGSFDIVFALSVLQRDPRGTSGNVDPAHLIKLYPFERFDAGVHSLVTRLRPGGLLCVTNALYRVEDSSIAGELEPAQKLRSLCENNLKS